ncbi:MAG: hypothetical protein R3Y62_06295, partial [Eubacteriales bacterium]
MKLFGGKGHKTGKRRSSRPTSTTPSVKSSTSSPTTPPVDQAHEAVNHRSRGRRANRKKGFHPLEWYNKLSGTQKGLLMLALSLVVLGGVVSAA